jgi:hypothetical protein
MGEPIEFRYGDIRLSINATKERLANPKPVLKEIGRKIASDIKANIKAGGNGWPPFAESTKKRLESTGTSQISKRGTVRADRVNRTLKALARVQKQIHERGYNPALSAKLDKLKKRVESYRKAEARAEKRGLGKRGLGPRQSENHPLLHRMPGTIRAKLIDGTTMYIYSAAGKVGKIHNDGDGNTPQRQMIPPPNMPEVMDYFKTLMESDLGQAWEQGKGR